MIKWIALVVMSTGILTGLTGHAPEATPLETGRVYQTGSPLSQPGLLGLLGGIAGTHKGGGFERWYGPTIAPAADVYNIAGGWAPATANEYAGQSSTLTLAEAQDAIGSVPPTAANKPRAIIPNCGGQLYVSYLPDTELGAKAQYTCKEN